MDFKTRYFTTVGATVVLDLQHMHELEPRENSSGMWPTTNEPLYWVCGHPDSDDIIKRCTVQVIVPASALAPILFPEGNNG